MKCCKMQHFIWVFTVCQSTCSGVSGLQGVNYIVLLFTFKVIEKHLAERQIKKEKDVVQLYLANK